MMQRTSVDYAYTHGGKTYEHDYWVRPALAILPKQQHRRLFDLGCGNGAIAADLQSAGFDVTGVDASESGIANANLAHPAIKLHVGSAYDDLAARYGRFPIVVSFEVVCYMYDPRSFDGAVFDLLQPGGLALISTPYHGYLKNLVVALYFDMFAKANAGLGLQAIVDAEERRANNCTRAARRQPAAAASCTSFGG